MRRQPAFGLKGRLSTYNIADTTRGSPLAYERLEQNPPAIARMNATSWYALALGALVLGPVLVSTLATLSSVVRSRGKRFFLQYLYYPQPPKWLRGSARATWFDHIVLLVFIIANTIAMSVRVNGLADFRRRSGTIPLVNLVPLFLGGRMDLMSRFGIGLQTYARMHRWIGRVAIAECLIHAIAAASGEEADNRRGGLPVSALFDLF